LLKQKHNMQAKTASRRLPRETTLNRASKTNRFTYTPTKFYAVTGPAVTSLIFLIRPKQKEKDVVGIQCKFINVSKIGVLYELFLSHIFVSL
jgi:hypothetical protein